MNDAASVLSRGLRAEVLCNGKTGCAVSNISEVFAKAFPLQCVQFREMAPSPSEISPVCVLTFVSTSPVVADLPFVGSTKTA